MIPSNDNLSLIRELFTAIGYIEHDSRQEVQEFEDQEVPTMSDLTTTFVKGGKVVKIQEIFVRVETGDMRVAIVVSVCAGGDLWNELYEFDDIIEHFRPDIREMRISKVIR
jgi:hypothetical protein